MDFVGVLGRVDAFLTGHGWRFALVGGVALAAYGNPRLTLDLDVVTDVEAQEALVAWMETEGYQTLYRSSGFSNHQHANRDQGRVDFIYVRDETASRLFAGVDVVPGPGGRPVPVPRKEHLIAMKVQAMKNDPTRTLQEMADVGYLLKLDGTDREEARGYFDRAGSRPSGSNCVVSSDQHLNLDRDLPVTAEDSAALRRLKAEVPSWLLLNARELHALIPPEGRRVRPVANDRWLPFSLD